MAVKRATRQCVEAIPYGLDATDHAVMLVPDEAEQAVIQNNKGMWTNGMTLEAIAGVLTERGTPTKTCKSTRWTHQVVARILGRLEYSLKR